MQLDVKLPGTVHTAHLAQKPQNTFILKYCPAPGVGVPVCQFTQMYLGILCEV